MNAVLAPLTGNIASRNLGPQNLEARLIDAVDAAVFRSLSGFVTTGKMADGDGEARVPARGALAHQPRLQHHNFLPWMQFGQAAGTGEARQPGADHHPIRPPVHRLPSRQGGTSIAGRQ